MKKKPVEQGIAEALGIEWDGVEYGMPEKVGHPYDKDGKDMTHPMLWTPWRQAT